MDENKKTVKSLILALLILAVASLYRQIGLHSGAEVLGWSIPVYTAYALLLVSWGISICRRVTQDSMRCFLYGELLAMAIWCAVRFLQESFLYRTPYLLRISGYMISVPIVLIPLFGVYSAICLGGEPEYKLPGKWYLFLIPAVGLILLMLTNEQHQLIFRRLASDVGINTEFHPNWGLGLLVIWAVGLEVYRLLLLYRKNRRNLADPRMCYVPIAVALTIPLMTLPYALNSFQAEYELFDITTKAYFLEILVWESCILVGMLPVNRQYERTFEKATVAMQITDTRGELRLASSNAPELEKEQFDELRRNGSLTVAPGARLRMYPISDGYFIWREDYLNLDQITRELQEQTQKLKRQGDLIQEELRVQASRARIDSQNRIYDSLSAEIGEQLDLIQRLMEEGKDDALTWEKVCFVGTYVKRYCNLWLILQETGGVELEDVQFTIYEMFSCLKRMGVSAQMELTNQSGHSGEFCLRIVKAIEKLLEISDFRVQAMSVDIQTTVRITLSSDSLCSREDEDGTDGVCRYSWAAWEDGWVLTLREQ